MTHTCVSLSPPEFCRRLQKHGARANAGVADAGVAVHPVSTIHGPLLERERRPAYLYKRGEESVHSPRCTPLLTERSYAKRAAVPQETTTESSPTPLAIALLQTAKVPSTMAQTDRDVLVAIHHATSGANWYQNTNWNTDADLSDWHGVEVNDQGRVVGLILYSNNLQGPIPAVLGNLGAMEVLSLGGNGLTGEIPASLGQLGNLQLLHLQDNKLSGTIPPELGELVALTVLNLGRNKLSGSIPPELGNLRALEELNLANNQLSGPIPAQLGNLGALNTLSLGGNGLTGLIPPELGKLAALRYLHLESNQLTGPIPAALGALIVLKELWLSNNELTGSIPPELGNLAALMSLHLNENQLSGRTGVTKKLFRRALVIKDETVGASHSNMDKEPDAQVTDILNGQNPTETQRTVGTSLLLAIFAVIGMPMKFVRAMPASSQMMRIATYVQDATNWTLLKWQGTTQAPASSFPKGSGVAEDSIPIVVAEEADDIPDDAPLQKVTLAKSLGPKPLVYVSTSHGVELEVQAGSLFEEVHHPVTVSPRLQFVECRTEGSGRAPFHADGSKEEEFLAMTFVHGPEQASFLNEKPAKLRFFVGYVDEFAPGDGSDGVVEDEDIEKYVLETYRPLTSPNGSEDWTVLEPYSVLFPPPVLGDREVWVETALCHFCFVANAKKVVANAMKVEGAETSSYLYDDVGRSRWRLPKGRPSVPRVFFGNVTENNAVFTYYPIVTFTETSKERDIDAHVEAAGVALGGGTHNLSSAVGGDRPAAGEEILVVLAAGEYQPCDLACGVKEHLQMHVRIGVLVDMTGEGRKAKGKLQLLDVRKISGNKILVLRQPRLSRPVVFGDIDWPCDTKNILKLGGTVGPQEPTLAVAPQELNSLVGSPEPSYGRTENNIRRQDGSSGLVGRGWVPLFFAFFAVALFGLGTGRAMPSCPAFLDNIC
ncbi:unnamed protein product [Scytosiphon promiscuus]